MAGRSSGPGKVTLAPLVLSAISPEERAARLMFEKSEAEKRLREAENRLREAIQELQSKQSETREGFGDAFSGRHSLCPHGDSCVANAVGSLCQSFLLAYGVRVGIGVILRAFKLIKKKPYYTVLDLKVLHMRWFGYFLTDQWLILNEVFSVENSAYLIGCLDRGVRLRVVIRKGKFIDLW